MTDHTVSVGLTAHEEIPDHAARTDSPEYVKSRARMNKLRVGTNVEAFYGSVAVQDHHGGGVWAWSGDDPEHGEAFMVRNLTGSEWSSQFCTDPAKLDRLRHNAALFYGGFPKSAAALGITDLLAHPIVNADDIAAWVDSIANASIPLPASHHTGTIDHGGHAGIHNYPEPVALIELYKRDDFDLWHEVPGGHVAVTPIAPRGSGVGAVRVQYATPGTELHAKHAADAADGVPTILDASHPLARAAFAKQDVEQEQTA